MKEDNLTSEAVELREQGYSIREIAEELNVSKSTVGRWLQQHDFNESVDSTNEDPNPKKIQRLSQEQKDTSSDMELGKLRLQYQHTENMEDKRLKSRKISLEAKEQELREREMMIKELSSNKKEEARTQKLIGRKNILVGKFRRLVKELLDSCQDYEWDVEDVDDYYNRVFDLRESIEDFCENKVLINYEDLFIWQHLHWIAREIDELQFDNLDSIFPSKTIEFDFPNSWRKCLKDAAELVDFDRELQESDTLCKFQNGDDDYEENDNYEDED